MLQQIWQSAFDFIASQFYVSPFWWWVFVGFCAVVGATLMGWYFSFLRPVAGMIFVAVVSGLTGYRRAEYDVVKHQEAEEARKAREPWRW